METVFSTLIAFSLMTEACDAIDSSYSSASGAAASTRVVHGPRTEDAIAAEDQIVAASTIIRTAYCSTIAACKAALVSLMTSLKSGPDYQRLILRLSSFFVKNENKNSDDTCKHYFDTYKYYLKVNSNITQLNHMTARENLGNDLEIKNFLLKMKKDMKEACESMVMLFIQHAKVCTKNVITLQPETAAFGDGFVCFLICFEETLLDDDLRELLKKHGTIHNLVKKTDLFDDAELSVFEVQMILYSHIGVTTLFQSLLSEMPSAMPVL
jgi:hypothetical protein